MRSTADDGSDRGWPDGVGDAHSERLAGALLQITASKLCCSLRELVLAPVDEAGPEPPQRARDGGTGPVLRGAR